MWLGRVKLREIAEHFGISWHVAAKLRATYGLPRRVVVEELDDIGPDEIRLRAIRTRAEQALGARFNVRDFHDALLVDGPLPLDLLDRRMEAWIEAQTASSIGR